jgi:hypothetical protein
MMNDGWTLLVDAMIRLARKDIELHERMLRKQCRQVCSGKPLTKRQKEFRAASEKHCKSAVEFLNYMEVEI